MKKFLFLFLVLAFPLRAQQIFTLDSASNASVADTITWDSAQIGHNVPLSVGYYHRGTNRLLIGVQGAPAGLFGEASAVSIASMSTGARVGKIDSVATGTVSAVAASGDTIWLPTYYIHFYSGKSMTFLNPMSDISRFLGTQTIVAFIKQ